MRELGNQVDFYSTWNLPEEMRLIYLENNKQVYTPLILIAGTFIVHENSKAD